MPRSDGRVRPGQKLDTAFSARAWNRAQDAADLVLGDRGGVEAASGKTGRALNVIVVRNDSGENVPIHGVLGLSQPAIDPAGGELTGTSPADSRAKQLSQSVVMVGTSPTGNTSRFCITLEPIAAGGFGQAAIAGVMAVRIKLPTSGQFFYAVTRVGDRTQLLGASCGPVRLLWHEPGPGDNKWAVAILS